MNTGTLTTLELQHIYVSAGHSYVGRHGLGSVPRVTQEVNAVECVAGRGGLRCRILRDGWLRTAAASFAVQSF